MPNQKIALITGATAGIGQSCARQFAQNGYQLILTGRRADRLYALEQELSQQYGTKTLALCFDIRQRAAVEQHINTLSPEWQAIDVLINNAGLAQGLDEFQNANIDDWEVMIDTNIKGLLYISRLVAPLMIKRGAGGHIVNVGSIAGKMTYPKGHVYCATKFAVDALTQAMRIDLLKHRIKVSSVSPGAAETEFSIVRYKGDLDKATRVYEGYTPMTAEDIADAVWYIVSRPAHLCIQDIVLTPVAQASAHYWAKDADIVK